VPNKGLNFKPISNVHYNFRMDDLNAQLLKEFINKPASPHQQK
jgi:hypothetical protein